MSEHIHAQFATNLTIEKIEPEKSEPFLSLRPNNFGEYYGQERVCDNLKIFTKAAKMRGQMLDHCLFHGPPGLGKTTLAGIIASEMNYNFKITSGPLIDKPADLIGILVNIEPNTLLFIDEIHRLPSHVEELLYSAMEDLRLDIIAGQGHSAKSVSFNISPFCLVGATTRAGAISAPLRDRFGIQEHLDYYSIESLTQIIMRSSKLMGVEITQSAAAEIARCARGTPRIANQLLKRVHDFALVHAIVLDNPKKISTALERLGVDQEGLSKMDRDFLSILKDRYRGGPVGLESIASALNEERSTLEDVYEPYLVYKGFIHRTPRGRVLSETGLKHLELGL